MVGSTIWAAMCEEMGIVSDVGALDRRHPSVLMVRLSEVGGKTCSEAAEKSGLLRGECGGRAVGDATAPATSILLWDERPPPPLIGSSLARKGISVSSISAITARSARAGATMARRSLAHNSQADL